jgi:hypothetical protein
MLMLVLESFAHLWAEWQSCNQAHGKLCLRWLRNKRK